MNRHKSLSVTAVLAGVMIIFFQSLPRQSTAKELSALRGGCASGTCGKTTFGVCFQVGDGCGTLGKCDGVGNGECMDFQYCTSNGCTGLWGGVCSGNTQGQSKPLTGTRGGQ
jgi:hypothetical protein